MNDARPITKISDAPIATKNPYRDLIITKRTKLTTLRSGLKATATNWETGEVTQHGVAFTSGEIVDTERFVKIFLEGMNAYDLLKATGRRVFTLLYIQMRDNADKHKVLLSRTAARRHNLKITESDFTRGIIQLLDANFIGRSEEPNIFWINPEHMFNGSRITFVKQYRLADTKKPEKPPQIEGKASNPDQIDIEEAINGSTDKEQ